MKSILLLGLAREGSTRLKNKMTREIYNGESLFDIYLKKFEELHKLATPFKDFFMAICPEDKKLWKMASNSSIPIISRSKKSVTGLRKLSELLECLESFKDKYKYVMVVNGCLPFLTVDTIIKAGNYFKNSITSKSMISVIKRQNWYWNENSKIINKKNPKDMATQNTPPVYETVHTFHTAPIKRLLNHDKFWMMKPNDPALFEINNAKECLDIDTEEDFKMCQALMKGGFK